MNRTGRWITGSAIALLVIGGGVYTAAPNLFSNKQGTNNQEANKAATAKVVQENGKTVKEFDITAKTVPVDLKDGVKINAWTFNGTVPGSQIRVTEGDRLRIKFKNDLPDPATIHWHGVPVPNDMDGVPGITQNAVKPGETFTYEFDAAVPGTYWYHSHQQSADQIDKGMYGTLVVEPKQPTVKYDKDFTLVLDEWSTPMLQMSGNLIQASGSTGGMGGNMSGMNGMHDSQNQKKVQGEANKAGESHDDMMKQMYNLLTVNGKAGQLIPPLDIKPGERIKLRFVNAGYQTHKMHLAGQGYKVTNTDGQPVDNPAEATDQLLAIAPGERYDVEFIAGQNSFMIDDHIQSPYAADIQIPVKVQGGTVMRDPKDQTNQNLPTLDISHYGQVAKTLAAKKPTVEYTMELNNVRSGGMGEIYTINGKTFPDTEPLDVKKGDIVKVKMVNKGTADHPMHLHGHFFQIVSKNGQPVTPLIKDTLNVRPGVEYEVIFEADNPGDWVFHCHDLHHAAAGMVTEVKYDGFKPNFTPDPNTANRPE